MHLVVRWTTEHKWLTAINVPHNGTEQDRQDAITRAVAEAFSSCPLGNYAPGVHPHSISFEIEPDRPPRRTDGYAETPRARD